MITGQWHHGQVSTILDVGRHFITWQPVSLHQKLVIYIQKEQKAVISAANETLENQSLTVTVRIRDVELNVLFEENVETTVKAQSSIHVLERDFADVIGSKKRRVFAEAVYTWQDGTISTEAESFCSI